MRTCSFEELSKKEVISCMDCTRLGYIVDLDICLDNAQIISITVELPSTCFTLKRNTIVIPWECIKKIGDDLIIADYILPPIVQNNDSKSKFLSRFFKN